VNIFVQPASVLWTACWPLTFGQEQFVTEFDRERMRDGLADR
jgi:hypothetical protein